MSSESKVINYRRWGLALAILLLLLLIAAVSIFFISDLFTPRRMVSMDINRPLVLFQSPNNHEKVETGSFVMVQVSARSSNGISKIELWVNGVKIGQTDPFDTFTENLTLTQPWLPITPGNQTLAARAFTLDGSQALSTITVFAVDRAQSDPNRHTVRDGEDLDGIADLYGVNHDDLLDLNPGLNPEDLGPGDDLLLPEDDDLPADPDVPDVPEGGEAPPPDDDPPVDIPPDDDPPADDEDDDTMPRLGDILYPEDDMVFVPRLDEIFPGLAGDNVGLQVELLGMITQSEYERLYCYLSVAGKPAERIPRSSTENDTDASFINLGPDFDWEFTWGLDSALVDLNKITVFWHRNRPLPINWSCVGITDSGTTAVNLVGFEYDIPPAFWGDNIETFLFTEEEEPAGIQLSIHRIGMRDLGILDEPDLTMTPPTNAQLNLDRAALQWDYSPNPGEEIDGFRIYLNNNLQWVENARARESRLPFEWIKPPCNTTYQFAVTAFRFGSPYGPESIPAETQLSGPEGDCQREIEITFLSLETFYLGEDGRRPPHHGDVGPVYGHFFANDHMVGFDTRDMGGGGGRIDIPQGLRHHRIYDLGDLAADPAWGFSRMPTLIVETSMDGSFQFGFHIMDQDQGRCRRPTDPGCDDLVCDFQSDIITGISLDQHHEGTMLSENGRCQVAYRWGPAFGSPVGSGVEGWEPLPSIYVEEIFIDDSNGAVSIEVRNIGTSAWPSRDLTVELQDRWGFSQGFYTWPAFDLGPGMRTILTHSDMILTSRPYDACVLIDPYDDVLEHHENTGAWLHQSYCPPLPDLSITDVNTQFTNNGQLHVSVYNSGDGPVLSREIVLRVEHPDGNIVLESNFPNTSIAPRELKVLTIEGVAEALLNFTQSGYRIRINPDSTIAETNHDNNSFDVSGAERLWIHLYGIMGPKELRNRVSYDVRVNILSGSDVNPVARWQFDRRINWDRCPNTRHYNESCEKLMLEHNHTDWFEVLGTETLQITVTANHLWRSQYNVSFPVTFSADSMWGSGSLSNFWDGEQCVGGPWWNDVSVGAHQWFWTSFGVDGTWGVAMIICREGD